MGPERKSARGLQGKFPTLMKRRIEEETALLS